MDHCWLLFQRSWYRANRENSTRFPTRAFISNFVAKKRAFPFDSGYDQWSWWDGSFGNKRRSKFTTYSRLLESCYNRAGLTRSKGQNCDRCQSLYFRWCFGWTGRRAAKPPISLTQAGFLRSQLPLSITIVFSWTPWKCFSSCLSILPSTCNPRTYNEWY